MFHSVLLLFLTICTILFYLSSLFQIDGINQVLRKDSQFIYSSNFIVQERHEHDMEVIAIQIKTLSNILVLHSLARHHLGANFLRLLWQRGFVPIKPLAKFFSIFFRKENLVDNNIVRVDPKFGKFLYQAFSFIDREKFWNADADLAMSRGTKGIVRTQSGSRNLRFSLFHS
jgi:hypothetical protein